MGLFIKTLIPMFEADGGQAGASSGEPAGEPQATQTGDSIESKTENMIPKSRFDEVNNKYKELLSKVEAFEKAEAERQKEAEELARKQAEEQGKFQELYESTTKELSTYKETSQKYESRVKELEAVINGLVEQKLKAVPKEFHDLIPENLTAEQTLEWLNKAESKGLFAKSEPKEIGKPMNHSNESPKVDKSTMSPLNKILAGLK